MKKFLLTTILLSLALTGLFAQKKVAPLPVDTTFSYGQNYFFYALPKTVFKVDVTVVKANEFKGVYSEYAGKLLGINNIIQNDNVSYSLKNMEVEAVTVADTSCLYVVEMSLKQVKSDMYSRILLQKSTSAMQQETVSYTPSSLAIPDFFRFYSDLAYAERNDNYVETQIVDGVVRQVPAVRTQKVVKSSEQKAHEAADMIAKIREERFLLLTGSQETAYSAETLEKMVQELNTLEKNYIELFTGFVVYEEQHFTLMVSPDMNAPKTHMFSVSQNTGFSADFSVTPNENYDLYFEPVQSSNLQSDFVEKWHCAKGHKPYTGYRVRVPNEFQVFVNQGNNRILSAGIQKIYQGGKIEILPLGHDDLDVTKIGFIY